MAEATVGDGTRIHYQVEGREDGPPLIFSNSLGTDLHMWDAQAAEAVGSGSRVIRYDQRGHGRSGVPNGPYSLARLADDVIDLMDQLKIATAAFCGLSMGGMTGIRIGKNFPRRFSRLALCNTATYMAPREMWEQRIEAVTKRGMGAVADGVIERWFTPTFRSEHPQEVERIRQMLLKTDPSGYVGCCAAIRDMDERDFLGTIEASALIVIGAHDPATTPDKGHYIAERIPGARAEVLDAAHLSNIERPDDFNRIVFGFLTGKGP
jgi:3-oxoadipate enol-lactonase